MAISRISRIVALFALLGTAAIPAACTSAGVFRNEDKGCEEGVRLTTDKDLEKSLRSGGNGQINCPTTTYHLPLRNLPSKEAAQFTYSFLELNEREPTALKSAAQWARLDDVLTNGKRKYVIAFIHGWRNDASPEAADDRRFRTLLTYSRQFLNYRCRKERRYCDTQLVGVFIGWRGSVVKEIGDTNLALPVSLWTFWNRKQKSEQHAAGIVRHLKAIESRLSLDPGNVDADKMLVLGHSFGGNMLATALQQCLTGEGDPKVFCGEGEQEIRRIADYETREPAAPPLGDLTVIVNPAAELKKWSDIQRAVRKRNGYDGTRAHDRQDDTLFRRNQRPTYIALTSTWNWARGEICRKGKEREECNESYDWATGNIFRLGQFYKKDFEERFGIGHVLPTAEHPYGASHEAVTNENNAPKTSIRIGLNPQNAVCMVQDGWLWQARGLMEAETGYWDTYTKQYDGIEGESRNRIAVSRGGAAPWRSVQQFRLGLSPSTGENAASLYSFEPANTPFWSVRTAPNAIPNHNSYISYPLWCSLNQMVLDDITKH